VDFSDQIAASDYFDERNALLHQVMEEVEKVTNNPNYIVVEGQSLQTVIKQSTPWKGVIWMVDGTLSDVRKEGKKRGFKICDGTEGTPDLSASFIRGAVKDQDSGATGGADTAAIADHLFTISNHDAHDHTIAADSVFTSNVEAYETVEVVVSADVHNHGGKTGEEAAMVHDVAVGEGEPAAGQVTLPHAAPLDIVPTYYAVIYVIKV